MFFSLSYFNHSLSQNEIDTYNVYINGYTLDDGTKVKGLNEYLNEFNQTQEKKSRLPLFKALYKMIMSDGMTYSWQFDRINSDVELVTVLSTLFVSENGRSVKSMLLDKGENSLRYLLSNINEFDTEHIYIPINKLSELSLGMTGDYSTFSSALRDRLKNEIINEPQYKKRKDNFAKIDKEVENRYKLIKYVSIAEVDSLQASALTVESYYAKLGARENDGVQTCDYLTETLLAMDELSDIIDGHITNIKQAKQHCDKILSLFDCFTKLRHFINMISVSAEDVERDEVFYSYLEDVVSFLKDETAKKGGMCRTWLASKPYSLDKFVLKFGISEFGTGWDDNKMGVRRTAILRKNDLYYLGIFSREIKMSKKFNIEALPSEGECYQLMSYKQFPNFHKMLPKCCFTKAVSAHFAKSNEDFLLDGDNFIEPLAVTRGTYDLFTINYDAEGKIVAKDTKGCFKAFGANYRTIDSQRYAQAVQEYIRFSFDFLSKYKSTAMYNINEFKNKHYDCVKAFLDDVNDYLYKLSFKQVSASYVDSLVQDGSLYLFQIYNRDFSTEKKGKGFDNLHTLFWKNLFSEYNLLHNIIKMDGGFQVYYRPASLSMEYNVVHAANTQLHNKRGGKKKTSTFAYDIIKDRRFTMDAFEFHVPIKLNYNSEDKQYINDDVCEVIRNNGFRHVIGIDRGERNLIYVSVLDLDGNIVLQKSLNVIDGIDYQRKLDEVEKLRVEERRKCRDVTAITNIKEGYLSKAVMEIVKLIREYDALVCLEDLNFDFVNKRQSIEKNVYSQFEDRLLNKLRYMCDKHISSSEIGGTMNALQLACGPDFNSLSQNGILFYVAPHYTSKIDPVTGFVNLLNQDDIKYKKMEQARLFFSRFDFIRYNAETSDFEFGLDFTKFKDIDKQLKPKWTLSSQGTRIVHAALQNGKHASKTIVLSDEFKKLFDSYGVDISDNIKNALCASDNKGLLENAMLLFNYMLKMRNSDAEAGLDYIISPVANKDGKYYDSREYTADSNLPCDADANGAYNIARKLLISLNLIKKGEKFKTPTNISWMAYAQNKKSLLL